MTYFPEIESEYNILEEIKIEGGYIRFKEWIDQYGKIIEYRAIWVDEDKRRKGLGTKLMKMLAKEAKKRGIKEIYSRLSTDGSDALGKFITSVGFKQTYKIVKNFNENTISWLVKPIIYDKEKEKYRYKRYGVNYKKLV